MPTQADLAAKLRTLNRLKKQAQALASGKGGTALVSAADGQPLTLTQSLQQRKAGLLAGLADRKN